MELFHVLARIGEQVFDLGLLQSGECSVISIINDAKRAWKKESVREEETWELSYKNPLNSQQQVVETDEQLMTVFMVLNIAGVREVEFEICEVLTPIAIASPVRDVPTVNCTAAVDKEAEMDASNGEAEMDASDGEAETNASDVNGAADGGFKTNEAVHDGFKTYATDTNVETDGGVATESDVDDEVFDEDYEDEVESDGGSSVSLVDESHGAVDESDNECCDPDGIPAVVVSSDEEQDGLVNLARYCSQNFWRPNPDGTIELKEGQVFGNIKSVRSVIIRYAIQEGFQLNKEKNDLCRYTVTCKNKTCDWRVHTSRLGDGVTFMIKSITGAHRMCPRVAANKEAKAKWVAEVMEGTIRANPNISLEILHNQLLERHAVDCDIQVVYRAKKQVLKQLRYHHVESYGKVRKYANAIITMNPGSIAKVSVNVDAGPIAKFHRFFLSFRAMQVGFIRGCRPLIGIDGCHLTSPFEGVMLCAVALDGDSGLFPIAFGVCEKECKATWQWFLKLLKESLGWDDSKPICFMSDRQKGCLAALKIEWPHAGTRYCFRHMFSNFMKQFKSHMMDGKLWKLVKAGSRADYNSTLQSIKEDSIEAYTWLVNEEPPEKWARYAFDHRIKSDHVTNNMAESFNKWVKKERDQPILSLYEHLRRRLMVRYCKKCEAIEKMTDTITSYARLMLQKSESDGRRLMVLHGRGEWYETLEQRERKILVSLDKKICECGLWQISGIPCKHVMAVLMHRKEKVDDHVHWYYTKEAMQLTYSGAINPIPDEANWPEFESQQILPPVKHAKTGRPKKVRVRADHEPPTSKKTFVLKCSVCKVIGHNSRTCPQNRGQAKCNTGSTSAPPKSGTTAGPSKKRKTSKQASTKRSNVTATTATPTPIVHQHDCVSTQTPSACNESTATGPPPTHVMDVCSQIGST